MIRISIFDPGNGDELMCEVKGFHTKFLEQIKSADNQEIPEVAMLFMVYFLIRALKKSAVKKDLLSILRAGIFYLTQENN